MHTLVFVGKAQSGKSSSANLLVGEVLKRTKKVPEYSIDEDGDLIIPTLENNKVVNGRFDPCKVDFNFQIWCANNLWSDCKVFNFADGLKKVTSELFGIPLQKLYGTNEDKSALTDLCYKDFKKKAPSGKVGTDKITVRESMQFFGDVCRAIDKDCFLNHAKREINKIQSKLSIVSDCRFPNEIYGMKDFGAKLVKLSRNPLKIQHASETDMDKVDKDVYDLIIPHSLGIEKKNEIIIEQCEKWGLL